MKCSTDALVRVCDPSTASARRPRVLWTHCGKKHAGFCATLLARTVGGNESACIRCSARFSKHGRRRVPRRGKCKHCWSPFEVLYGVEELFMVRYNLGLRDHLELTVPIVHRTRIYTCRLYS